MKAGIEAEKKKTTVVESTKGVKRRKEKKR